ncbi:TspO/MBR family protein [Arthrobacter sp. TWP1-1]|uniref:TspO/MBR family protein n=1 Tax=Arthrobacter sp. TWP1-1 TaxID=2804568 RepID=UPI003CEACF89
MKQLKRPDNSSSLGRPVIVAASAVVAVVGSFIGSGAAGGTEIQKASGGALAADATLLAPAGPAFSIWSVIYLGLLAYAVWQFLPQQRQQLRHQRLGYPVAASLLLNAAWILSIQFDQLWLSVPIIIVLLMVLLWIFALLRKNRPTSTVDAIVTDGSLGLYLGWVCVATGANIAAWSVSAGWSGFGISGTVWALGALAAIVIIGLLLAVYGKGRLATAASFAWGLSWLAVARISGDLESIPVAVAALIGAALVLLVTIMLRLKATPRS